MDFLPKSFFVKIPRWLTFSILFYIVFIFGAVALKYHFSLYNGLDLAIFNHTFWQTIHGNFFGSSINPPSYFGDHFAPFLILLIPFYWLIPHPLTLLFLQTLFLASSAIPLYLIAKRYLPSRWVILVTLSWLFNPFLGSGFLILF